MFDLIEKEDEMLKLLIPAAVAIAIFIQAFPAYCGVSRTATFELSVTIPEHIVTNSALVASSFTNNPFQFQLIQTQIVMRNNKSIRLTSIVVP
jgi:hypothetical protein